MLKTDNKIIRIGVDARSLTKKLTGIGYYCWNLLKQLDHYKNLHFILFGASTLKIPKNSLTNITYVEQSYSNPIMKQLWFDFFLPQLLKKYHIDLFWGPSHCLPLLLKKNIPSILTIHDLIWKHVPKTMRISVLLREKLLMPMSLKKANVILTVSEHTKLDLITYKHFYKPKILVTHPGADNFPSIKNRCLWDPYILCVGTQEPRKNLHRLLNAYALLPENITNKFSLIIVGQIGWGKIFLDQEIKKYNLKNKVSILGYVDEKTLHKLYLHAYCLAMPSLYEGFGLPIAEAQRAGTPVLTSNCSSMPEIAGNGAIFVDPYDVISIRNGLEKLLINKKLHAQLSKNSIEQANKFSWNKTAKKTYQAFKKAYSLKTL